MLKGTQVRGQPDWAYKWENNSVYVSADGGTTWRLFMYFPSN